MPQRFMIDLALAHGLMHEKDYALGKATTGWVRTRLNELEKSELVQAFKNQPHRLQNPEVHLSDVIRAIESGQLDPHERTWLDEHEQGISRMRKLFKKNMGSERFSHYVMYMASSGILSAQEKKFLTGLSQAPKASGNALRDLLGESGPFRRPPSKKEQKEAGDIILESLMSSVPSLTEGQKGKLMAIFNRLAYVNPMNTPDIPSEDGLHDQFWHALIRPALALHAPSGRQLEKDGLWDLLQYGRQFHHVGASVIMSPPRGGLESVRENLRELAQALGSYSDQVDPQVQATLLALASNALRHKQFITGIRAL